MRRVFVYFLLAATLAIGCGDDEDCTKQVAADELERVDQTRLAADIITIDSYLAANGIVATEEPNGVRYVIHTQGDGPTPCLEDYVVVVYEGRLLKTGSVFDPPPPATPTPVTFQLGRLILGWKLVMPSMQVGTKLTMYIPSGFGYGPSGNGTGTIPSNANLVFDVEFQEIL